MSRVLFALLMLCLAVGCSGMGNSAGRGEAPRMAKEELKARLGSPDLVLIDVRYGKDWSDSERKIAGAVREDPKQFKTWQEKYPKTKTLVLYCAWTNEGTSAGLALKLIGSGYAKVYALKGGWNEWLAAGYPVEPK